MATTEVEQMLILVPQLLDLSHRHIWMTYDEGADVLYINLKKPSHADDSEITDGDTIVRYEKGEVVGITILNASKRQVQGQHA